LKQKHWDEFVVKVNAEAFVHGQAENVFGYAFTAKNCQARFSQLMDFAKKYSNGVPLCSGDDSKLAPTELQTAIEQIFEDFGSYQHIRDLSRHDTLAGKERDKAAAEFLRRSALVVTGML
jgi:hypothetical protein